MDRFVKVLMAVGSLAMMACSPSVSGADTDHDGAPSAAGPDAAPVPSGPPATVSGTVWAPGNAPGLVPAGEEIPISGALIYITRDRPAPIPSSVYCERCQDIQAAQAVSDARGRFTISDVPPGESWLVVEKGQFRRETRLTLAPGATVTATDDSSTLPSKNDWANGMTIPRVAIALGAFDYVENILGKMGIGAIDSDGSYIGASGAGLIDFYNNDNEDRYMDAFAVGDIYDLIGDVDKMKQYHVIFFPCSGTQNTQLFSNVRYRQNIIDYVNAGGKFYVADWSAEWEDAVWPAYIQFSAGNDTPPNPGPQSYSNADDTDEYDSSQANVLDTDLAAWLDGQRAPINTGGTLGTIDASHFTIYDNWDHIQALPGVAAVDENGNPITQTAKTWVAGDWDDFIGGSAHPLTVTFEPTGCGRVLYTTYHTTGGGHPGLLPQERILVYLIMELGVCKSGPIVIE